jgi:hypothetical protein
LTDPRVKRIVVQALRDLLADQGRMNALSADLLRIIRAQEAGNPYLDATGNPVVPDGGVFGNQWTALTGGRARHGDIADNIRLHYPEWEIAFEPGHPVGPNQTHGRAAIKPWARTKTSEMADRLEDYKKSMRGQ